MTSGDITMVVTFAGALSDHLEPNHGIVWDIYKREIVRGIYVEHVQWDDILSKNWVFLLE